jgi:hypothetical protein
MPRIRFEPMTPVFERAKTIHALDRAATVIGNNNSNIIIITLLFPFDYLWQ